jgi:hypothetical protein
VAWGLLAVGGEGKPCGVAGGKDVLLFHFKYFNLILCFSPLFHAFHFKPTLLTILANNPKAQ